MKTRLLISSVVKIFSLAFLISGIVLAPGAVFGQDYSIPEIYNQLPGIIGTNVTVLGYYTNPEDSMLVFDYELFQDDELMPPSMIAYIDGPAAPSSMWYGAYVSVDATVDTFRVDDPYWPEDSVQVVLTNIAYTLISPPSYSPAPGIGLEDEDNFERDIFNSFSADCDSCKFAILLSGGANSNYARYWNNIAKLYKLKTENLNYCPDNVFTLYHKGNSEDTTLIPHSKVDSCNGANVANAFKEVSKRVAACRRKSKKSKLQLMITNHGRADGHTHLLGSATISPDSLRSLIQEAIDSCLADLNVEMVQCYGGRPADSLRSLNDKKKTTINVSSAAGDQPHRSDVHHPDGGWATYLKVKIDKLKAGAKYEDAVKAGLAAYDSLLKAQGLETRRGNSVHWRSYPMKKYCEWHMVEVPPGGQLVLEFSGDTNKCGNVKVYEEQPDGTKKVVAVWNWNIPGSAGYSGNNQKRVVNADSTSTGRFWIHNDNGEFRVIATSEQKRLSAESDTNLEVFAGHSQGGDDDLCTEFGNIVSPTLEVIDVDQVGFELDLLPRGIGQSGVQSLTTRFTNYGNEYWSDMELWLDVLEVIEPGDLLIEAPAESAVTTVDVTAPGEITIPLGAVFGDYILFNPGGIIPESADFTLDAWGLRVTQDEVTDISDKEVAPHKYHVYQSYPNPFNPVCTIRYEIPVSGRMSIRIYDVEGRLVRNLADKFRKPGVYSEVWNGKSDKGRSVASGVYFYQFKVNDFKKTGKMILMR